MTLSLKRGLYKAAHAIGYTVVPNWRAGRYPQCSYLRDLFRLVEIDCVLDVGANVGQYRDLLRHEVDYKGNIVSFEPIRELADAMRKRGEPDQNWIVENCALGAATGTALFNVMATTTFSSFLQPTSSSTKRFEKVNTVCDRISVAVRTLDDLLPDLVTSLNVHSLYLKLDTQGYDLEVLRGAARALSEIRALQTEVSVRPIYDGMPDFLTTLESLRAYGFEPSGIFPNAEGHFPELFEFDFHMINRQFARLD